MTAVSSESAVILCSQTVEGKIKKDLLNRTCLCRITIPLRQPGHGSADRRTVRCKNPQYYSFAFFNGASKVHSIYCVKNSYFCPQVLWSYFKMKFKRPLTFRLCDMNLISFKTTSGLVCACFVPFIGLYRESSLICQTQRSCFFLPALIMSD